MNTGPASRLATGPSRRVVIVTLGVAQILVWSSSYYLLAVLGRRIAADTGWSLSIVVGLSLGLLGAARAVEMTFGGRYHPIWTLTAAKGLVSVAVVLLVAGTPLVWLAVITYGAGNGLWSIARGAMPLALFGPSGHATLISRFALFGLLAQAMSPSIAAVVLDRFGSDTVLSMLALMAQVNAGVTATLWVLLTRAKRSGQS